MTRTRPHAGVLSSAAVCRSWKACGYSDAVWTTLASDLWVDACVGVMHVPCLLPRRPASLTDAVRAPVQATKSYVPQEFRVQLKREGQARRAFFAALKDSTRTRITKSELCSFTWSFRFKRNAGKVVLKPVLNNANESTATRRAAQASCRCHTRALLHVARAHTSLRACTRMRACSNAHANAHSRMAHAHARMRRRGQKKIRTGPACLLARSSLPHILCQKTPL